MGNKEINSVGSGEKLMSKKKLEPITGAVPVMAMPFDIDGIIDGDSLRRQIDFCIEAGAKGIAFGIGSESGMLTDAERIQVWTLAAKHIDGQRPLVAATSHASREGTIALTRLAGECGADCAMVNPQPLQGEELVRLFDDLSQRVALPLMIQDVGQNASADVLVQATQQAEEVVALKIESPGAPHKIGQVVAELQVRKLTAGERQITVLGGSNGNHLPEELSRGSVGTIPFPAIVDAYQTVCDCFRTGDTTGGQKIYLQRIVPLLRAAAAGGGGNASVWIHKAILQRAGILRTAYCRMNIAPVPDWIMENVWQHLVDDLLISRRLT